MTSKLFAVLGSYVYSLYRPSLTAHASRAGTVSFPYMESYDILAQDRTPTATACSTSDLVYLTSRCPFLPVEDVEVLGCPGSLPCTRPAVTLSATSGYGVGVGAMAFLLSVCLVSGRLLRGTSSRKGGGALLLYDHGSPRSKRCIL